MSGGNCVIEWPRFEKKNDLHVCVCRKFVVPLRRETKDNAESNSHHIIHPFKYHAYGTIAFL